MTEKQAARIELLLRHHTIQMHNLLTLVVAQIVSTANQASQSFVDSFDQRITDSLKLTTNVLEYVKKDSRAEAKASAELQQLAQEMDEELKRKPPTGFKPKG